MVNELLYQLDRTTRLHPLDEVAAVLRKYMDMSEEQITVCTLYAAHAAQAAGFSTIAYIHISAATEEAGKTRLGEELLGNLISWSQSASFATVAALKRLIGAQQADSRVATFILDEVEKYLSDPQLAGFINKGFNRGSKSPLNLPRQDGGWDTVQIDPFCPKILISIGPLPSAELASRCIPIHLVRRSRAEGRMPRLRLRNIEEEIRPAGVRMAEWMSSIELRELSEAEIPAALSGRQADCWEPLLVVANAAGGEWPSRALKAIEALYSRERRYSLTESLLRDTRVVFEEASVEILTTEALNAALTTDERFEWGNYRSATGVLFNNIEQARMLRNFGIEAKRRVADSGKKQATLEKDQFIGLWERYGL